MPRGPRVDAPGTLHHATLRGIERREIFRDDADREAFLARLDRLALGLRFAVRAWALMPNHVHLVVTTDLGELSRLMARLGTSYAMYFNRRHGRAGHLFQNRFWSRPIDRDVDEVVAYVHRNPVRAGLTTVRRLPAYPWCGHGACVGARARRIFEGAGPERSTTSERLARVVAEECRRAGLASVAVSYGRSRAASELRARIVVRALRETRLRGVEIARALGISQAAVSKIATRSARAAGRADSSRNVPDGS